MNIFLTIIGVFLILAAGGLFIVSLTSRQRALTYVSFGLAFAGIVVAIVGQTIVSIGPNERMVVFSRISGDLGTPRGPGFTLVNPLTTSYRIYDISRQTYTMSSAIGEGQVYGDDAVQARTSGGQEVNVEITVIYSIDPSNINEVHINWPDDRYRDELVRPLLRSVIRDSVSKFTIDRILEERESITENISAAVIPAMEEEGFIVQTVLLRDIAFTPEYAAAIEAAQIAEVKIREEEFNVQAVQQQAQQEQERARGDAEARRIRAEGEASALNAIAEALQDNPELLEYQYVQNLSDNVQILALPANSPYLFDLQSLIQQQTAVPSGQ